MGNAGFISSTGGMEKQIPSVLARRPHGWTPSVDQERNPPWEHPAAPLVGVSSKLLITDLLVQEPKKSFLHQRAYAKPNSFVHDRLEMQVRGKLHMPTSQALKLCIRSHCAVLLHAKSRQASCPCPFAAKTKTLATPSPVSFMSHQSS